MSEKGDRLIFDILDDLSKDYNLVGNEGEIKLNFLTEDNEMLVMVSKDDKPIVSWWSVQRRGVLPDGRQDLHIL